MAAYRFPAFKKWRRGAPTHPQDRMVIGNVKGGE